MLNGEKYYYMCALNDEDARELSRRICESRYKDIVNIEIDYKLKLYSEEG